MGSDAGNRSPQGRTRPRVSSASASASRPRTMTYKVIQPGAAYSSASSPVNPTGMPTPSAIRHSPDGSAVSGTRCAAAWAQRGTPGEGAVEWWRNLTVTAPRVESSTSSPSWAPTGGRTSGLSPSSTLNTVESAEQGSVSNAGSVHATAMRGEGTRRLQHRGRITHRPATRRRLGSAARLRTHCARYGSALRQPSEDDVCRSCIAARAGRPVGGASICVLHRHEWRPMLLDRRRRVLVSAQLSSAQLSSAQLSSVQFGSCGAALIGSGFHRCPRARR